MTLYRITYETSQGPAHVEVGEPGLVVLLPRILAHTPRASLVRIERMEGQQVLPLEEGACDEEPVLPVHFTDGQAPEVW